jgi:Dolichyl-phosphate-mannose-protein mannosyltransferase
MTDNNHDATTPAFPARRGTLVLVPLLLLIFVLQCAWFIRTQSFTNDEPEHIVAGLEAWRFGEFQHWSDQPPLGRLLFSLPLLNTNWQYQLIDKQVHPITPAPEVWLYRARPVTVLFGIALLLLLWATARNLFSETAANFVLALAVLSPDLIAHFSLATIDGIGCLFVFACVVQWLRYWRNPSWAHAAILGVLSGLLLLAKFNSPPLLALLLLLVLVLAPGAVKWNPAGFQWRRTAAILLIACLVVWAGYFFHVSRVTFANQMVTIHFAGYTKLLQYEMPTLKTPVTIFWPACEWFTGLGMVVFHNMEGHRSFLLGHYANAGLKLYFPAAMLLKWPLLILLMGAAGTYAVLRRKVPGSRDLLLISLFSAVYFFFAITARINIGVRHVLPLYPFLLLYAGAFFEWARGWRWGTRNGARYTKLFFGVLLIAQAADIARYAPDYLSYFTVLVKPVNTWQLLSDSNNDWGQGFVALRQFQAAHPNQPIHLAYVGEVDPAWYGIRYTRLHEDDRPTGLVIVSATHLSGQLLTNHYAYRWLLQYPLVTILNHTLYVFDVPENAPQNVPQNLSQSATPPCTPARPHCDTDTPAAPRP